MKIAGVKIDRTSSPFVIAELSGNHNGSLDRALKLVEAAANAGVDCIKLQTYSADTLTLDIKDGDFVVTDPKSLWTGRSLHDLFEEAHTPWEWHEPIMKKAAECGLICFSSPFDETAVDFLETLNVPAYKIGSFECVHIPLLRKVASTGKPVILSTGMATVAEIDEAVKTLTSNGCTEFALLKCTSSYPSTPSNSNLKTLPHLRDLFSCEVGLSDHTLGLGVAVASIALGGTIIEKHFTLARSDGGIDSVFSMEPLEMKALVIEAERAFQSMGEIHYGPTESEVVSATRRRSIYISQDLAAGEVLNSENMQVVRPGNGLAPKFWELIAGKRVNCDLAKGTPVSWDILMNK